MSKIVQIYRYNNGIYLIVLNISSQPFSIPHSPMEWILVSMHQHPLVKFAFTQTFLHFYAVYIFPIFLVNIYTVVHIIKTNRNKYTL